MTVVHPAGVERRPSGKTGDGSRHCPHPAVGKRPPDAAANDLTGLAFLSPWVLGFLAFTLYPLVATVYYSFTDYSLFGAPHSSGCRTIGS